LVGVLATWCGGPVCVAGGRVASPMVFGIEDATRRAAGVVLPRLDITRPVLQVVSQASVRTIAPTCAFRACLSMINARQFALLVAEGRAGTRSWDPLPGEQMQGLLTAADFFKLPVRDHGWSERQILTHTPVADLMTPVAEVTSAPSSYTLKQCVDLMEASEIHHSLPVVEDGEVRTLLSMRTIGTHLAAVLAKREVAEAEVRVGDLLDAGTSTGCDPLAASALPTTATVADAVEQMRETGFGALLVLSSQGFGIFTERDYVHSVLPRCAAEGHSPADVPLVEPARWATDELGYSKRLMEALAANPELAGHEYRPDTITCVERSTPIRDALRLMLGNGLLYVPVIENDLPTDIISMRDINLFLARNDACEEQ